MGLLPPKMMLSSSAKVRSFYGGSTFHLPWEHLTRQRHTEGRLLRLLHTNFTELDLFAASAFDDAPSGGKIGRKHHK